MQNSNEDEIRQFVIDLMEYFNRRLTENVQNMFIDVLKKYPVDTVGSVIKEVIHTGEKMPRIRDLSAMLQNRVGSSDVIREYAGSDEANYPLHFLESAFQLLVNGGKDRFKAYCDSVMMPVMDRKRVIQKYRSAYKPPEIKFGGVE